MICWYTTTKVDEVDNDTTKEENHLLFFSLKLLGPVEPVVPNDQVKPTWDKCVKKTLREVRCQSWGILLSHPFQGRFDQ
jgi:hypothetical protein